MVTAGVETLTTSRGLKLDFDPADRVITAEVRDTGQWEEPVAAAIERHLQPGWTFLDLGAHVGYFALLAAARGNPVIAVEANLDYERLLRENARANGLTVESHPVAVSNAAGPAFLDLDRRYGFDHPGAAHLSDSGMPVTARRLVDVLGDRRPEFIKLDIEGMEYAVLADSLEVLDAAQVIVFEVGGFMAARAGSNLSELLSLLRDHRFEVTYIDGTNLDWQVSEMRHSSYANLLARKVPDGAEVPASSFATLLLCAYRSLTVETAECMMQMRDRGWSYTIGRGDALIQRVRSRVVSEWYRRAADDVFLMIDDDVVFPVEGAESVVALAREKRSIAVGAYPVKDGGHLACRAYVGQRLVFGDDMPPVEIQWPATGFMAVHRDVITAMIESGELPLCGKDDRTMWPFFDTFWITGEDGGSEYLSEDYAFGERARRLGFKTWLDQSVILFHMGGYPYNVHNMPTAEHTERPEE